MTIGKGTHRVITLDMLSSISAALTRSKNAPNTLAYIRDLIAEDGFVLNDQQANTISRDVTKEEHVMLMGATLRSSTVIAKGRLVDTYEQCNRTAETPANEAPLVIPEETTG